LNELSNNSSIFSPAVYPELPGIVSELRKDSIKRKNKIDETYIPSENSIQEPVVSHAELNGLLGSI
jgi:hypothetical protein